MIVCSLLGHRRRELETCGGSCQSLVSKLKTMNLCMKHILRNSKQTLQTDLQTGFQSWEVCSSDMLGALPRFWECFERNWHLIGRHQMVQSFWLHCVDCGHLGSWRMGRHAKYLDKQQCCEATTDLEPMKISHYSRLKISSYINMYTYMMCIFDTSGM